MNSTMSTADWQFRMLGAPRLLAPDGDARRCEGKALALLSYLALEKQVSRARMADLLWPEVSEVTGRNNLVITLRRFQRHVGAELWTSGEHLRLQASVQVDARQLLEASEGPGSELWKSGSLLEGYAWPDLPEFSEWLLTWRERLDSHRTSAALTESRRLEATGEFSRAQQAAQAALSFDPLSEEAYRALMRLCYLQGDRTGALRAYEKCARELHHTLHTSPMQVTQELARAIEYGAQLPVVQQRPPAPLQMAVRLVGREGPWTQMATADQQGKSILLLGEAGAGKTRLATEFTATWGRTMVLEGRPGDSAVPYATVIRTVRRALRDRAAPLAEGVRRSLSRLLPELGNELDLEEGAGERLRQSIAAVLGEYARSVVGVIVDDLHYMDDASIEITGFLAPEPRVFSWLPPHRIICARPSELRDMPGKAATLLIQQGAAVRVELSGLANNDVRVLLDELGWSGPAEWLQELTAVSGGNPMFVIEAARHLRDHTVPAENAAPVRFPARLEHLISGRLGRLSQVALSVARAASVLERELTSEQLAEMLGLPLMETVVGWEELETAELVRGERFSHDLLAETVYRGMPTVTRNLLHRSAARLLGTHGGGVMPARVARHWLAGDRPSEGVRWLSLAARAARDTFRPREAAAFYEDAAGLYDHLGESPAAFEMLVGQVAMLNDLEEARPRQVELVQALFARATTPVQEAEARRAGAVLMSIRNDIGQMERLAREGLSFIEGTGEVALEADLTETLAASMLISRRPQAARAVLIRLLSLCEQLGNVARQAVAYDGLGQVAGYTSPQEALRLFSRAEELCLQAQDAPQASAIITKQARIQQKLGRYREALQTAERAMNHLSDPDGYRARQLINVYFRTLCWQALGEHVEALAQLTEAQRLHQDSQSHWLDALEMQRVRLLLDLGQVEAALEPARTVMASPRLSQALHADRCSMWAAVLIAQGRREEAVEALNEAQSLLETYPDVYLQPRLQLERAALLGPAEARPLLQEALQMSVVHHLRGLELAAQTRLAQAQLTLDEAPLLPDDGDPDPVVLRGELLTTRARVLARTEDPHAVTARETAQGWYRTWTARFPPEWRACFPFDPEFSPPLQ